MRLSLLLAAAVLAFTATRGQGHEVLVCPPNDQLFISNSRSLLPLENVQASSESLTFPIANILSPNAAATWCTNAPSFIGEHVNFTFTEPVVLTMIVSSSAFPSHYVNNFSIAYSSSEDSNGSSFDIYGVTSMPQDFLLPSLPPRFFTFEESIIATRLQLVINDGVSATGSDTCWTVGMLGCTLSEAETIGPTESDTSTLPSSVAQQHTSSLTTLANPSSTSLAAMVSPSCQLQPGSATSNREGATREEVLAIALPIAFGIVAIVILIVTVGVVICNFKNPRKKKWSPAVQYSTLAKASEPGVVATSGGHSEGYREREETLRAVDNALYEGSLSVDLESQELRNRVATLREVENDLYGDNVERSEERTYETVAGSVLGHLEESTEVIENVTAGSSCSLTEAGTRRPAGNEYESVILAKTE